MEVRVPQPYLQKMVSFGNTIENIQFLVGIFCVVCFVAFVTLDVSARSISEPVIWAQEVAMFTYVWAIFLGSSILVRRDLHFKIDILLRLLPRLRRALRLINLLLAIVFAYVLIVPGWQFAMMGIKRVSNPSGIPLIVPTIVIPIAGVFFLYFLLEGFVCTLARWTVADVRQYLDEEIRGRAT